MAPKSNEELDFEEMGWTLGKELGSGHFAKVKRVTRTVEEKDKDEPGVTLEGGVYVQTAACKIIKKPKDLKKQLGMKQEYDILKSINNEYVVKCFDAFETDDKLYLFLELMSGGELFDRIVDMGHFTEAMAQDVTYKLVGALAYMHSQGIAHRDLKPENMLMTDKTPNAQVKITDFGLSKFFDETSSLMKTPCGTPGYIAPEVLHMRGYDQKCDVWSMGVIVYILLCGFPPFYADNDAQLFDKIKKGQYEFLKPYWDPISENAKAFVRRMLVVKPEARASMEELLGHEWLAGQANKGAAADSENQSELATAEYKEKLTKTSAHMKKLKGVFLASLAMTKMSMGSEGSTA